ncbi:MAG: transposase [Opitutaceae bacterium]|nr:transposase [Opitutaceae bacterium]
MMSELRSSLSESEPVNRLPAEGRAGAPPAKFGLPQRNKSMTAEAGRAGPLGPPSAGTKSPRRKILPHHVPGWVKSDSIFFVTICCQPRGINQLCHEAVAGKLFEAVTFRHQSQRWYVRVLLLMPDHLHALVSFPHDEDMRQVVANFKELTAKRAGVSWQRDFFDHRLRAEESLQEKWEYIRMNPVRKGLIDRPEQWPYVWRPE